MTILLEDGATLQGKEETHGSTVMTIFAVEENDTTGIAIPKMVFQGSTAVDATWEELYEAPAGFHANISEISVVNLNTTTAKWVAFAINTGAETNRITPNFILPMEGLLLYTPGQGWKMYTTAGEIMTAI